MNGDLRTLHSPLRRMIEELPVDGALVFSRNLEKQVIQTVQRVRDASGRVRRFQRAVVDGRVQIVRLPDEGQTLPVRLLAWEYFRAENGTMRRFRRGEEHGELWASGWPADGWVKSYATRAACIADGDHRMTAAEAVEACAESDKEAA